MGLSLVILAYGQYAKLSNKDPTPYYLLPTPYNLLLLPTRGGLDHVAKQSHEAV